MSSQGDQLRENVQDSPVATPVASNTGIAPLPPHPSTTSEKQFRSEVWADFTRDPPDAPKASCNFCGTLIKCSNGTSGMWTHLKRCKENPNSEKNKKRKRDGSSSHATEGQVGSVVVSSPTILKFDQDVCRKELVRMFIVAELPFRFVENEAFIKFLSVLQPRFVVPSRSTLRRDIEAMFVAEQTKLKLFMSKHCGRVCLTTDTWTSNQNFCYMSLTAHFIDNDWTLQKKVLNFRKVTGHSGEVIAANMELLVDDWGLSRVLTVTCDNATSNDTAIRNLKTSFESKKKVILKGKYLHMRCCAHILNLIVKEGLKEIDDSIVRIRTAVRYIRASTIRYNKFMACAKSAQITYQGSINIDMEPRWNSTYTMLDDALKFQRAFELYEVRESKFEPELRLLGKGVPTVEDWDYVKSVLPFLKIFYGATKRISGSYYVTSNKYMKEVFAIGRMIKKYEGDRDPSIKLMATNMKKKYDKYWGKPDELNVLLFIAVVLDPQSKWEYLSLFLKYFYGPEKASELKSKVNSCLKSLYELYEGREAGAQSTQRTIQIDDEDDIDVYGYNFFIQETGSQVDDTSDSELEKYLTENREAIKNGIEFDILKWWNVNSSRFPTLSSIARDVLAIPVSTVASESAFSTGGRVLNDFRSSLAPPMVEKLICTQDWLKRTSFSLLSDEDFEELERYQQELVGKEPATGSENINLDDDDI